jgi:parallel beta-helix repeat protein
MKSSVTAVLAALAFALVPASLQAKVIKVPSVANPTIQDGVNVAAPGDTVLVQPGTYDGSVYIGHEKAGLKLKAAGPVKIVGPGPGNWIFGIEILADNVLVEGFDISGFAVGIWGGHGAPTQGGQITRNTVHDCAYGCIVVDISSNYEIDHNTVVGSTKIATKNGQAGISVNNGSEHHIHHNQVTDVEKDGIFLGSSPGCTLDHNVSDNNGEFGIYVAGGSSNCTVDHNQTDNNGPCPIAIGSLSAGITVLWSPNCAVTGNEANNNASFGIWVGISCGSSFERNVAEGNGVDLFAPGAQGGWDGSNPWCNTYEKNQADTAEPDLATWDVKPSKK